MRGFTDFYYEGKRCFIREEYEQANEGLDELQRLEEVLGCSFTDVNTAMNYTIMHAPHLLYRLESDSLDSYLLSGKDPWVPFKGGFVHTVTAEFVPYGGKPDRDSYPCWKLSEPASRFFDPNSALQMSGKTLGILGLLGEIFGLLADITGGKR